MLFNEVWGVTPGERQKRMGSGRSTQSRLPDKGTWVGGCLGWKGRKTAASRPATWSRATQETLAFPFIISFSSFSR